MCPSAARRYALPVAKELFSFHQNMILGLHEQSGTPETDPLTAGTWAREGANPASFASDSLFAAASEPVLIVDSATGDIVEANPAAAQLFGIGRAALVGTPFLLAFEESSAPALQSSLAAARGAGSADPVRVRTVGDGTYVDIKLSLFRANPQTYVLVRLTAAAPDARASAPFAVFHALDSASVGFLVTNSGFLVEYANRAFVEMVELNSHAEVCGESLARWLKFSAVDMERLRDQMFERRAATLLCTSLRPQINAARGVEVCAVAVPDGPDTCWGFTVRELPRLN
jgi:PAS domain-containing protein